jgi:hypothetical protein
MCLGTLYRVPKFAIEKHHAIAQTCGWHRLARKRAGVVFNVPP